MCELRWVVFIIFSTLRLKWSVENVLTLSLLTELQQVGSKKIKLHLRLMNGSVKMKVLKKSGEKYEKYLICTLSEKGTMNL